MDGLFKQKLLILRNPPKATTFSEALLGDTSWMKKTPKAPQPKIAAKEVFTEKGQVIESFERFAQEKATELKTSILKVDGGEILVKSEAPWELTRFESLADLKSSLKMEKELLEIVFQNKNPGEVKVVFVSEKFRSWSEVSPEIKTGFINELLAGLPAKTAEFFERMIIAMKLQPCEVIFFPVEGINEEDLSQDVMEVAAFFKAEIVITLGAKSTNKILKSNDRLTMIHGQFFSRKIAQTESIHVVPLFHPSIIETNLNMKKTAWADMQKIMKHLKKLP